MTIYEGMSDEAYHSRKELSSTGARRLLDSPARFRWFEDNPQPPKTSFDVGHAAHTKILGTGAEVIEYPEEFLTASGNASTSKAAKEWEALVRTEGLTPIAPQVARQVDGMAEAVLADPDARQILETITGREVTIVNEIDGVPVRARFDIYDGLRAADLKTTTDASPRAFNRDIGKWGYHVQYAWYSDAHAAETGYQLQSWEFIVVEKTAPHLVGVYDLDHMWREKGHEKAIEARITWKQCVRSNVWPSYGRSTLVAPTWVMYEGEETEIQV